MLLQEERWIRSFARRSRLSPENDKMLGKYSIQGDKESIKKIIGLQSKICIEIGFGNGEHILYQALNQPDVLFIGCEPYLKGVSHLLTSVVKHDLKNILVWIEDARKLIVNFPDKSIEKFFIFFPDPWPKRSHNKRRLINAEFLNLLTKKMSITGETLIATDHPGYAEWIELYIAQCNDTTYTQDDFGSYALTKYHRKALQAQRKVRFFRVLVKSDIL
ncbi:tRNA (guanosine(46)-N7)-methyltransferase TrmB [Wolbachia endosymbiont of Ctenocephalides felis wCfeT]|uniref:tRNA (guanosine(46)-N7)-methyltransferase TrmB n=1 Tax=Wolbachia endosymbiont of Ctenocephalides felis wCfeT TaxID=2732593 RepID=UPI0014456D2D|nr:tRNA (guanosine(46)-N7)-methyltransferase TrmB [Wolbachia endosymbiont of Ctenocephalides felis wCfeT]